MKGTEQPTQTNVELKKRAPKSLQRERPPGPDSTRFGCCPVCHNPGEIANIRKSHWMACSAHRLCWYVGMNLFSCWRDESEEIWERNAEMLDTFQEVEPWLSDGECPAEWFDSVAKVRKARNTRMFAAPQVGELLVDDESQQEEEPFLLRGWRYSGLTDEWFVVAAPVEVGPYNPVCVISGADVPASIVAERLRSLAHALQPSSEDVSQDVAC